MTRLLLSLAATATAASPAAAHVDAAAHGSFAAGFAHPFFGLDHVLVMAMVGLWAAMLGGRAIWLVPGAFLGTMLLGFAAALAGLHLPFVEPAIAASLVVVGLATALVLRVPTAIGMALVAVFALFHGFAHGGELGSAGAAPFAAGFAVSTALLHAAGIGLGLGIGWLSRTGRGGLVPRLAGGATALAGLWLGVGA